MTDNEDYRQDLWVHYLSGDSSASFSSHLDQIKLVRTEHEVLQQKIWQFINDSSYAKILEIIVDFSEFEKSIIVLLVMGLNVESISRYKHIDEIRINQAISAIRENSVWKALQISR